MMKNLISLLLIIISIIVYWSWTKPQLREVDRLRAEKAQIEEALLASKRFQKIRDSLLEKYNQISSNDRIRLSRVLPASPESIKLMVAIENLTKKNGVTLKKINIEKSTEGKQENFNRGFVSETEGFTPVLAKPNYKSLEVTMTVSAPYNLFKEFLNKLEKSLRIFDITEINFSSGPKDLYEFNIKGKVYFQPK